MSKLAKRVDYPFTGHQPSLPAPERRTPPSRDQVISFLRTHERMYWSLTDFLEMDWREIDVEALTEVDLWVVETTMLVESNNPDYVANLIEYFQADQEVCDFLMMWAVEEWKHYYALRDYLGKVKTALDLRQRPSSDEAPQFEHLWNTVNAALSEDVDKVRSLSAENWGIPPHYYPVQVTAATSLQEFITAEFYRSHAAQTREPVLAELELQLSKDEARHEMFYEARTLECLERNPEQMDLVVDALKEFAMPGAAILDDYTERRTQMEKAAFPTRADRLGAFRRVFSKVSRLVGNERATTVFSEGNYLVDGDGSEEKKRPSPEAITRLITRRL